MAATIVHIVIAGIILLVGVSLSVVEIRAFYREPSGGSKVKLLRRMFGGLMLVAVAIMIYQGRLPEPGQDLQSPDLAWGYVRYWVVVLGLTCLLLLLALWDIWAGIRGLRKYLDDVEEEEIVKLKSHLQSGEGGLLEAGAKNGSNGKLMGM